MQDNKFKQLDGSLYPRFAGIRTFFRLPILNTEALLNEADVAILGVPFDGGTSFRPGARFAPEHIRSMSALGRGYYPHKETHLFKNLKIGDAGDVSIVPQDIEKTHTKIAENVKLLLDAKCFPMIVGGDHSTTIGSMQAVYDHYGPFNVIHFDAHTDTYPAAWGCDVHHGTFMRLGYERGWFRENGVIQIGIRGPFSTANDLNVRNDFGYTVFSVDDLRLNGLKVAQEKIKSLGSAPTYLSFDIDCLDPAFAPGTGTPVPGGMTSWEAFQLIRAAQGLNIVAADIVEVSPPYDNAEITSLVAVYTVSEILALLNLY
ncbi:MAG: agmatinase [bacterium]|nr:agmatinase [bacterium]